MPIYLVNQEKSMFNQFKTVAAMLVAAGMSMTSIAWAGNHFYASVQAGDAFNFAKNGDAGTLVWQDYYHDGEHRSRDLISKSGVNKSNIGARISLGDMFTPNFGIEAGVGTYGSSQNVLWLGDEYHSVNPGSHPGPMKVGDGASIITTKVPVAIDLSAVVKANLNAKLYAFAKAGVAYVHVEQSFPQLRKGEMEPQGPRFIIPTSYNSWHIAPRAELGLGYNLSKQVALTASYAYIFGHSFAASPSYVPSIGFVSMGLSYRF